MKLVVDEETGEIIGEINTGDRILRKASIDFLKNQEEQEKELVEVNEGRRFIKIYEDVLKDLVAAKLTNAEHLVALVCLGNLSYVSGAVRYRNTGEFLTPINFEKETGLSKMTVWRAIEGLVEKDILQRGKRGNEFQLFANPYIFMKGKKINQTLFKMFKSSRWYKKHKNDVEVGMY